VVAVAPASYARSLAWLPRLVSLALVAMRMDALAASTASSPLSRPLLCRSRLTCVRMHISPSRRRCGRSKCVAPCRMRSRRIVARSGRFPCSVGLRRVALGTSAAAAPIRRRMRHALSARACPLALVGATLTAPLRRRRIPALVLEVALPLCTPSTGLRRLHMLLVRPTCLPESLTPPMVLPEMVLLIVAFPSLLTQWSLGLLIGPKGRLLPVLLLLLLVLLLLLLPMLLRMWMLLLVLSPLGLLVLMLALHHVWEMRLVLLLLLLLPWVRLVLLPSRIGVTLPCRTAMSGVLMRPLVLRPLWLG